ncbi:MAG: alpha/beta fold hydrolase [Acidimicrobiia bacterium]
MPAVLVHGVPDTPALWDPVGSRLDRADVVTPQLPGFGAALPDGFEPTKEAYADWLVAELEAIGEPVDLVGHDWGSLIVQRVASTRPDLVRTLACGAGTVDVEYPWHPMAQLWQTPGAGEDMVDAFAEMSVEERVEGLAAGGSPRDLAELEAPHIDPTMGRCILGLYRSAVDIGAEWQPAIDAMPPRRALVLWGRDDPFVEPRFGERLAVRLDARLEMLPCGHWWPWERAAETAAALQQLWS